MQFYNDAANLSIFNNCKHYNAGIFPYMLIIHSDLDFCYIFFPLYIDFFSGEKQVVDFREIGYCGFKYLLVITRLWKIYLNR